MTNLYPSPEELMSATALRGAPAPMAASHTCFSDRGGVGRAFSPRSKRSTRLSVCGRMAREQAEDSLLLPSPGRRMVTVAFSKG